MYTDQAFLRKFFSSDLFICGNSTEITSTIYLN